MVWENINTIYNKMNIIYVSSKENIKIISKWNCKMFVHRTGHYLVVSKGWYFGIDLILDVLIISLKFMKISSLGISLSLSKINYLISDNQVSKYSFYTYCVLVYIALERRGGGGRRCITRQVKIKFFIHLYTLGSYNKGR